MYTSKRKQREYTQLGKIQMKILILLGTGLALGLSGNPTQYFRILRQGKGAWDEIEQAKLKRSVKKLQQRGFIRTQKGKDGGLELVLSKKGNILFRKYRVETLSIQKPKKWDNKWRIIIFDIPEERRSLRNVFRKRIKQLGCYELQKSVFVHPYECFKEMEELTDFYHAEKYVNLILASSIRDDGFLKRKFKL